MSDIVILKAMLKDLAIVPLVEHPYDANKKQLKLTELNSPVKYSVTIDGIQDDNTVIAIKADELPLSNAMFNGTKGECKRADFILVINDGKRKFILFIELKSKKTTVSSPQHIIQQLKGAKCIIRYCREIGIEFWGEQNFLDGYEERYIFITDISIPKRETRYKNSPTHDRPDRMLKISSPNHLQINQLIGSQ